MHEAITSPKRPEVLVRTHGGYPRRRILWEIEGRVAIVVEPEQLAEVYAGDETWEVGVPLEDVYKLQLSPASRSTKTLPFQAGTTWFA